MIRLAKRLMILLLALATLVAAFSAGIIVAPVLPRSAQETPGVSKAPASTRTEQDMTTLSEAWRVIERDYYGTSPDPTNLTRAAIQGLVNALDDPYSAYLTAEEMASYQSEVDGSLQSIGISIEKRDGQLMVVTPLTSSPAHNAGIQPGDVIARIDGRDTASLTLGEAIGLLRGPEGSKVTLMVLRNNSDALTFTVERGAATAPLLTSRMLPESIGYVNIAFLDNTVGRDLGNLLQQMQESAVHGIIIDLRNNPGGYLDTAIELAGLFIPDGVVVSQQGRTGSYTWSYKDQGSLLVVVGPDGQRSSPVRNHPLPANVPLVVLVNQGTASAAEVLAAALQDHKRAALIGERTFGKGAITGDYTLSDGSSIHMTNGQWLSPNGHSVNGRGLTPDIPVEASPDRDNVLDRASEYLMTKR